MNKNTHLLLWNGLLQPIIFGLAFLWVISTVLAAPLPPNLGELQVTPPVIPPDQSVPVTVTLRLQHPDYVPGSAVLQRLDDTGQPVVPLASFRDDGQEGDETAGDGVFTARTTLFAMQPTDIRLGATAGFRSLPKKLRSLSASVQVKPGASLAGPWAVVEEGRVVFRDLHGKEIHQEPLATPMPEVAAESGAAPKALQMPKAPQERAIVSADGTHVGIIRPLPPTAQTPAKGNAPVSTGWEFHYLGASETLWTKATKDPERYFYLPESSPLLSTKGDRVLLIDVSEDANDPVLAVYDRTGQALLREKAALAALIDARLSTNGRYVLLKGLPPMPKRDLIRLIVIDVDHPKQRWTVTYHGGRVTSEEFVENALGGFDIWLNEQQRYSFPR